MIQKIKTYDDLELEKKRLMADLKAHEEFIKVDIAGVKAGLKPVSNTMNTINKFATRDNTGPVMNFGLEMGVDLLVRKFLLARAGWFVKIVVPFIMKNYSSHIIRDEKREALVNRIRNVFNKIRPSAKIKAKPASTPVHYQTT